MLWPSLEGYTQANARSFADPGDRSPVVSLALSADAGGLDTNERFERVWMSLSAGSSSGAGGTGPVAACRRSGWRARISWPTQRDGGKLFAARCFTPRDQALAANCERTVRTATGLMATYRFRQVHLADWRAMDGAIATLVASFAPLARSGSLGAA
ncbi:MAG: hypothetical protein HPM95_17700 [Alphaproteobacteria bacterium]|nr:hypothetical protein [Alphaproteobacteria bacterium]